tara:strand:+ start:415 stop:615 length:201 start_codon:yes stop_codon:yes gene_type:complete
MNKLNYFLRQMTGYDTTAMYIDDLTQMDRAFAFNDSVKKLFNELSNDDKSIANEQFFKLHNKTLKS